MASLSASGLHISIIKGQDLVCSLRQDQVYRHDGGSVDTKHQCMMDSGLLFDPIMLQYSEKGLVLQMWQQKVYT